MQRYELGLVLFSPSSSSLPEKKKRKETNCYCQVVFLFFQRWSVPKRVFRRRIWGKLSAYNLFMSQKMAVFFMNHNWVSLDRTLGTGGEPVPCATRCPKRSERERACTREGEKPTVQVPRAWWIRFSMLTPSHTHWRQSPFFSCSNQLRDAAEQTQTDVKHKMKAHLARRES